MRLSSKKYLTFVGILTNLINQPNLTQLTQLNCETYLDDLCVDFFIPNQICYKLAALCL